MSGIAKTAGLGHRPADARIGSCPGAGSNTRCEVSSSPYLTSVCLGWLAEQARRRGSAIDAIVKAGGSVGYKDGDIFLDSILNDDYIGHFWPDMTHHPVIISTDAELGDCMGECLAKAAPIDTLYIWTPVHDESLSHITKLNDGCELVFYQAEGISEQALRRLEQRLPGVHVSTVRMGAKNQK